MTNLNHITVGLLIPTFNRRSYLEKALDSALEQKYGRIEIIVIDNGSNDSTAELMAGISDPRVRYVVNEKNIGMIGSINKGISLFTDVVKWCTIMSDDDELDDNFIKNMIHSAVAFNAKSIVHSHRIFIDEQGNRIREASIAPQEETALDYLRTRAYLKRRRETYLTGVLFNRNMFNDIGGYPPFSTGLASDDAFIFALALRDRLLFDKNAVAYIRIHEKAESQSYKSGIIKIKTMREFEAYCERVAEKADIYTVSQVGLLKRILRRYVKDESSNWWLRNIYAIFDQNNNIINDELSGLVNAVMLDKQAFWLRVRFDVFLTTILGTCPERYPLYRFLWDKAHDVVLVARGLLLTTMRTR